MHLVRLIHSNLRVVLTWVRIVCLERRRLGKLGSLSELKGHNGSESSDL